MLENIGVSLCMAHKNIVSIITYVEIAVMDSSMMMHEKHHRILLTGLHLIDWNCGIVVHTSVHKMASS